MISILVTPGIVAGGMAAAGAGAAAVAESLMAVVVEAVAAAVTPADDMMTKLNGTATGHTTGWLLPLQLHLWWVT